MSSAEQKNDFSSPKEVDNLCIAFGGRMDELLPGMASIPEEFHRHENPWVRWQMDWFYKGLEKYPTPKDGIDPKTAMRHLAAIQGSFQPKHEHKMAAVAYLASLWFEAP